MNRPVKGRNVVVVEDIADSGRTIGFVKSYLRRRRPKSVRVASLLYKNRGTETPEPPEYVGFTIPEHFVFGYGLDHRDTMRNRKAIYRFMEKA